MKQKLLLCFALVLGGICFNFHSRAAIVYAEEPEGGRQMVMEFLSSFIGENYLPIKGIKTTNGLTFAPPLREYGPGNLVKGQLITGATSGQDGWQMWGYIFMHGTNAVGYAKLEVDEKTGKPLKCNTIGDSIFNEEIETALREAEQWPQVQKQDYVPRFLEVPIVSFFALWLHGHSNDIIIPLPPTYDRMAAYQPYSESQITRILAPEARRDVAMWAKLNKQRLHDNNAYAEAMTDYEKAHGNQCGPVSLYGMSQPFQEVEPHVQIFTLMGKSSKCGELEYKVKVTFENYFDGVKKVEIIEKLPGKAP